MRRRESALGRVLPGDGKPGRRVPGHAVERGLARMSGPNPPHSGDGRSAGRGPGGTGPTPDSPAPTPPLSPSSTRSPCTSRRIWNRTTTTVTTRLRRRRTCRRPSGRGWSEDRHHRGDCAGGVGLYWSPPPRPITGHAGDGTAKPPPVQDEITTPPPPPPRRPKAPPPEPPPPPPPETVTVTREPPPPPPPPVTQEAPPPPVTEEPPPPRRPVRRRRDPAGDLHRHRHQGARRHHHGDLRRRLGATENPAQCLHPVVADGDPDFPVRRRLGAGIQPVPGQ